MSSHPRPWCGPSSLWLPASTCWGESSSSPCFGKGMQDLLSPKNSTNRPNFLMAAQNATDSTDAAGRKGAMYTRWTCGNLGDASLSLGGFWWQIQWTVKLSSRQTLIGSRWEAQEPHFVEGCKVTSHWRKQVCKHCKDIPCLSHIYLTTIKIN